MRFLSLFAGIGGFDLGLERAGMECAGQVEIDPFCNAVLAKHWPDVPRLSDIREVKGDEFGSIELVCGGFPCLDTSQIGGLHHERCGIYGERSGLWWDYLRLVWAIRPLWVIVENPEGVNTWARQIAAGLEGAGYGVSRIRLKACGFGAPHVRPRVFFIANAVRERWEKMARFAIPPAVVAPAWPAPPRGAWRAPGAGRAGVDDGVSHWMERTTALGNAVVPQVVERIGRAIMEASDG